MTYKLELKSLEKAGKIIVLIWAILTLSFFTVALFSQLSGKNVSIGCSCPFLGLLINVGILMLIFASVCELIRTYRETAND